MTHSPTMTTLLDVPRFERMMRCTPTVDGVYVGRIWQVWAHKRTGGWLGKQLADYPDALDLMMRCLDKPAVDDAAIVCRPRLLSRPKHLTTELAQENLFTPDMVWCWRCRRPVVMASISRHHALSGYDRYSSGAVLRCPYCGIRAVEMESRTSWRT